MDIDHGYRPVMTFPWVGHMEWMDGEWLVQGSQALLEPTKYIMSVMQIKLKGGWSHELETQEVNVTGRSKVTLLCW